MSVDASHPAVGTSSAPAADSRPSVVAIVFRATFAQELADSIRSHADRAEVPVEVRMIGWAESPEVRRARLRGDRSARWIHAHERPLDDEQRAAIATADVLVAMDLPSDIASVAPRARFVQSVLAGVGPLIGVLRASGLPLASAAGLSGDKVGEFALARIFAIWTDARTLDALQRARRWAPREVDTTPIAGRSLIVVGTGGIGQAIARRAAAFGVRTVGIRRRPELGVPDGFQRVATQDELTELLPIADAVVLAVPATGQTERLIGARQLGMMKRGAVLCNVARGALVDEEAVVAALHSGHLGAAVLDVVTREPLSRTSPLWSAPRAYLSPHVANDWRPEYLDDVAALVVENVAREERGESLRNAVDFDEGY